MAFDKDLERTFTAFRITSPSGGISEGVWRQKADIPQVWTDHFMCRFFTEDTEVIPTVVTESQYLRWRLDAGQIED